MIWDEYLHTYMSKSTRFSPVQAHKVSFQLRATEVSNARVALAKARNSPHSIHSLPQAPQKKSKSLSSFTFAMDRQLNSLDHYKTSGWHGNRPMHPSLHLLKASWAFYL